MPPWTLCGHSPAISLAQHCKTLHWVKPAILAQEPRLAWAGHLIAPPPGFAQFSNAKPVGGRGISDFQLSFFSLTTFFRSGHRIAACRVRVAMVRVGCCMRIQCYLGLPVRDEQLNLDSTHELAQTGFV